MTYVYEPHGTRHTGIHTGLATDSGIVEGEDMRSRQGEHGGNPVCPCGVYGMVSAVGIVRFGGLSHEPNLYVGRGASEMGDEGVAIATVDGSNPFEWLAGGIVGVAGKKEYRHTSVDAQQSGLLWACQCRFDGLLCRVWSDPIPLAQDCVKGASEGVREIWKVCLYEVCSLDGHGLTICEPQSLNGKDVGIQRNIQVGGQVCIGWDGGKRE